MNKELKKFAMSKIYFLIAAWIVILGANTILMLVAFDCRFSGFSTFIALSTPFLIICYSLLWWIGVNAEFEKAKKFQNVVNRSIVMRTWKEN